MGAGERDEASSRHPWEMARAGALAQLLANTLHEGVKVLGVGCGDGYLCRTVFGRLSRKEVAAVDPDLPEARLNELEAEPGISYGRDLPPARNSYDLTLIVDVLERVKDDRGYLKRVVRQHVAAKGRVLVTVPAFDALYSGHDWFRGHYRRYRLRQVEQLAWSAGLVVVSSGYLFGSLLIPRFLSSRLYHWGRVRDRGRWRGGRLLGALVAKLLTWDNALMIALARAGILLPGATAWALCENRRNCN
ncbi:class I SAM-dependent methyltransferase [Geomonas anaerohicana]|uniref:Methyltransferase domain-containing protein n=1 Tax=Geomonas anaerohicana TaxID=2798583 RepID=A0ABS0YHP5_9BACT|nr:class I SAM-dependent methyltransferase [Geomonas anaerohicana]MBJ6751801.1 methyltransferase domain-containing protein [Geomonas anaerohicana]